MSKRIIKQFIIALVFISILSCLGFLIYYLTRPSPSCSDGIQNQDEQGIDCGGQCDVCDFVNIEEIEVLWAEAILVKNNFYDLAAKIKNPNQNYGSGQIPYEFELYDSNNNLIARYSGTTFILPNQSKYIIRTKAESISPVNRIEISFGSEIEWRKPDNYQPPQLLIKQKEYRLLEDGLGFSQTRAVLDNKTDFNFDKVDIDILLFDASHNLLALNTTELRTLLASQERDFVATWFNEIAGQVAFVEMEAETNIFDSDNFILTEDEGPEPFQEY